MTAASFFADLAHSGDLLYNTIRTYRSALGTWWLENTAGARRPDENPFRDAYTGKVLKGVKKELAPALILARQAKAQLPPEIVLDSGLLRQLLPHMQTQSLDGYMLWTATLLAVFGLLRKVELLGSSDHPDRYVKPSQVVFYESVEKLKQVGMRAPSEDSALCIQGTQPSALTLDLGVTKADAFARNPPLLVHHPATIATMWKWMHMRRALSPTASDDALFQVPGKPRLTMNRLLQSLSSAYVKATGSPAPHFAGKIFRRSGASNLLLAGATGPELQAAGRWKSAQMPLLYASAPAKDARAAADIRSAVGK